MANPTAGRSILATMACTVSSAECKQESPLSWAFPTHFTYALNGLLLVINGNTVHWLSFRVESSSGGGDRLAILGEYYDGDLLQFAALHTGGDHRVCIDARVAPR